MISKKFTIGDGGYKMVDLKTDLGLDSGAYKISILNLNGKDGGGELPEGVVTSDNIASTMGDKAEDIFSNADWKNEFDLNLPVATTEHNGIVQIGSGLNVDTNGLISVNSNLGKILYSTEEKKIGEDDTTSALYQKTVVVNSLTTGENTIPLSLSATPVRWHLLTGTIKDSNNINYAVTDIKFSGTDAIVTIPDSITPSLLYLTVQYSFALSFYNIKDGETVPCNIHAYNYQSTASGGDISVAKLSGDGLYDSPVYNPHIIISKTQGAILYQRDASCDCHLSYTYNGHTVYYGGYNRKANTTSLTFPIYQNLIDTGVAPIYNSYITALKAFIEENF